MRPVSALLATVLAVSALAPAWADGPASPAHANQPRSDDKPRSDDQLKSDDQKSSGAAAKRGELAATVAPNPLPAPVTTDHTVTVGGRTLHFKATAGAIRLSDAHSGEPLADVGYVAYQLDGADPSNRPLAFAVNGGPGASSAWLDLGALGPWRLPFTNPPSPSASTALVDNAETWLDFTDLVFIDPPGTGYSRILSKNGEVEKHFYSVEGDIEALSTVMRKWLFANDRLASPKYIVGESYGGFRAPKLAQRLENTEGIGIKGLIMISPVLDFNWFQNPDSPVVYATQLPSLVAAARGIEGPDPRAKLQAAEAYASGAYLVDLYRGVRDAAAVKRMSAAVANLTGLDAHFVQRLGGRVDASDLTHERLRDSGRMASAYDSLVTGYDREPFDATPHAADPILDTMKVRLAGAMAQLTAGPLKWPVNARYESLNNAVNSHWDWGGSRPRAEAIGDLKHLLSLDPNLRILVAHGVTDEVTPYFASKMEIDQIPPYGDLNRVALKVYAGGHMLYLRDDSRAALREDARTLIGDTSLSR